MSKLMKMILTAVFLAFVLTGCQTAEADRHQTSGKNEEETQVDMEELSEKVEEDSEGIIEDDQKGPTFLGKTEINSMEAKLADYQFIEFYLTTAKGAAEAVDLHYETLLLVKDEYEKNGVISDPSMQALLQSVGEVSQWSREIQEYQGKISENYEEHYRTLTGNIVDEWGKHALLVLAAAEAGIGNDLTLEILVGSAESQQSKFHQIREFFIEQGQPLGLR